MAVLPVLRMGHPLLLERAVEIRDFNTQSLDQLIADMLDTMRAEDGAGLAAPQIGVGPVHHRCNLHDLRFLSSV